MVNSLVIVVSCVFLAFTIIIAWKNPRLLKKNPEEPLSIKNFSLKKAFIGDWKQFFTWIILMIMVFSYIYDIKSCAEMRKNIDEICMNRSMIIMQNQDPTSINFNELNFGGEDGNTRTTRAADKQGVSNSVQGNS